MILKPRDQRRMLESGAGLGPKMATSPYRIQYTRNRIYFYFGRYGLQFSVPKSLNLTNVILVKEVSPHLIVCFNYIVVKKLRRD